MGHTLCDSTWALGSGQWALGSGQWAVGSGQWALGSGQWAVGIGPGRIIGAPGPCSLTVCGVCTPLLGHRPICACHAARARRLGDREVAVWLSVCLHCHCTHTHPPRRCLSPLTLIPTTLFPPRRRRRWAGSGRLLTALRRIERGPARRCSLRCAILPSASSSSSSCWLSLTSDDSLSLSLSLSLFLSVRACAAMRTASRSPSLVDPSAQTARRNRP